MTLGNKTLEDLLTPISEQLGHFKVPEKVELPEWEFKAERVTDGLSHAQHVDLFVSEAEKVRVQVSRCPRADLASCIAKIVGQGVPEEGAAGSVVCADDERFANAGVYDAIKAEGKVSEVTVWDASKGQENVDKALVATYGLTYAAAGIAETGTIVQPTSPACGRAISLLPLAHIAVVDATSIAPTMAEILAVYASDGLDMPSQVCFISGPSATADIELVRVEGVHGPMYVYYVVVE